MTTGAPADAPGFHNPDIISPHLDELHSQGVELMDHHVYRYCAPTRSSFLSGRLCAPRPAPPALPAGPRPAPPALRGPQPTCSHTHAGRGAGRGAWAQAVQAGGDAQELQPRDGKGRAAPLVQDHRGQATERGLLGAAPPFRGSSPQNSPADRRHNARPQTHQFGKWHQCDPPLPTITNLVTPSSSASLLNAACAHAGVFF